MSLVNLTDTPPAASTDFELLFESAPISLWLEDYSAIKSLFDGWRAQGVVDFRAHLRQSPALLAQCSASIKVLKVNQKTLQIFAAQSQEELVARVGEVLRDDTFDSIVNELEHLWLGDLEFSNQSVNYALDGRRMNVQVDVRVLKGHEYTWNRVMVALQDITPVVTAQNQLGLSERYARSLFDHSPVSLWVEDFSRVKILLDGVREQGIEDFRVFISVHPEFVTQCMQEIRVLDVNRQTLAMFAASDKDELLGKMDLIFRDEMHNSFAEQLCDLWNGKTVQLREVINYSLNGALINIYMQFSVMVGHDSAWDRVLVSLVDITARKKAEAYLEYLGKHDSLTRLRNRAFYVEELNRVSRKGPWPLSILAMDLNGLKQINDSEGHAAGDAMLRRAGEVLTNATAGHSYCLARIGGDEFIALMPGCDDRVAQGLKERIATMVELNNQFYPGDRLSIAIGVDTCHASAQVEASIHAADQAMFADKERHYAANQTDRRRV